MAKSPAELIAHYLEFGTPVEFDLIAKGVVEVLGKAGYVIVPRSPTETMCRARSTQGPNEGEPLDGPLDLWTFTEVWKTGIDAALADNWE